MTQADGIYPELSVWENLSFFAALYGQTDKAEMRRTLQLVELDGRQGTPAQDLSGGMRRPPVDGLRAGHHPTVILPRRADGRVDPALRVQFWNHFHRLAADGATLVVSSHVMDEADRCDELLFIRDGHVLAQGTPAELRKRAGTETWSPRSCSSPAKRRPRRLRAHGEGNRPMNPLRVAAVFRRIVAQFRRDPRSLALLFVAPLAIIALLGWC